MIHYLMVWICIFLMTNNYKNPFICLLATYTPFIYSSPLLTFNWAVCLFCCIVKDLYIFWISDMVMTNIFYNFLFVSFFDDVLLYSQAFNFHEIKICLFFLLFFMPLMTYFNYISLVHMFILMSVKQFWLL